MIRFECQICGGEVLQAIDARGLPDRPDPCPHCAEATAKAVEIMRARDQLAGKAADA